MLSPPQRLRSTCLFRSRAKSDDNTVPLSGWSRRVSLSLFSLPLSLSVSALSLPHPSSLFLWVCVHPTCEVKLSGYDFMSVPLHTFLIGYIHAYQCNVSDTLTNVLMWEKKKSLSSFFLRFLCFHIMSQDVSSVESYEDSRRLTNIAASWAFFKIQI